MSPHALNPAGRNVSLIAAASVVLAGMGATAARSDAALLDGDPVGDPVVSVAGDIACPDTSLAYNGGEGTETQCRQKHTSDMILDSDHVFVLGDAQYSTGSYTQYMAVFDPTWGRKKAVTHPTPGDHDYQSGSPAGYFDYWGVPEYYSFDIGSWHWISLNSEIDHTATSAQTEWLVQDLESTTAPCIGAFWSTPTFSSGHHGNDVTFRPFWDALYEAGADLVLAGDDHDYERFAKMAPDGTAASDGIREFVVGTGGRSLYEFETIQPNSEVRAEVFGVLDLTLLAAGYSWLFRTESGGTFSDSGNAECNAKTGTPPPDETPTPTPTPEPTLTPEPTPTPTDPTPTDPATPVTCAGVTATIVGTSGPDTLNGTDGPDVIDGLNGGDVINGGAGHDLICGAGGSDDLGGGPGDDRVRGGWGADAITDLSGADILEGNVGDDAIDSADGRDGDTANGGWGLDQCSTDSTDTPQSCEQ